MKRSSQIGETLELLYGIREEVGSGVEKGVGEQLDQAIERLQKAEAEDEEVSGQDTLRILGDVLKAFAAVAAIIEALSKLSR